MKPLHELRNQATQAWAWFRIRGRNGRQIADGIAHLYLIEREPPPSAIEAQENGRGAAYSPRTYWRPWQRWIYGQEVDPIFGLNPLCGRLQSASRFPQLNPVHDRWGEPRKCPTCRRLSNGGVYVQNLVRDDPWTNVPEQERRFTPDPITGL